MAIPYLTGNYAPVLEEVTEFELSTTGTIPGELSGWYLRNGPNPHAANSRHWFAGDGMVHGVRIEGGRAVSYRNRWVRTTTFTDGAGGIDAQGNRDYTAGVANTHVIRHAGRTLALVESSFPYEITCELDTLGPHDFDGKLTTAMTAHPKTCPTTGELHFFGYDFREPYLTYHRADAAGNLEISRPIDVPAATMHHDFVLSAEHVVFMDLPVLFDLPSAMAGGGLPFRWNDDYQARLGVLRRDDPHGAVRWFDIDPCYVFHTFNAYDEPGRLIVHVMRHPSMWRKDSQDFDETATLWRWTIDLNAGTVREEQLDDRAAEFPRIDDRLAGLDARFGHATAAHDDTGALLRYDLHTGVGVAHDFGPGRRPDEACFAPADETPGGEGYLMTYVYDAAENRSDLVILSTEDLTAAPMATIHLPRRVPFGFHGNWLPDH
ncbi:9-cis-epoxycarotenoid dioxygenase [Nocardia sp. ET3-3]|uniref:Dioxygenase n=1 Tax=Nocardia terrae TaxID=2675851 RepID=A0A7K1UVC7_9NOCA|nr:carotenoid oxygenase family protein [Nocardia terrae]MVU78242.1 9-cis-epoxycarotenoid dioxygenase [Nocardia terrae]